MQEMSKRDASTINWVSHQPNFVMMTMRDFSMKASQGAVPMCILETSRSLVAKPTNIVLMQSSFNPRGIKEK